MAGNSQRIYDSQGTGALFTNNATFTNNSGTGTFTIAVPFNNAGLVNVQAGTLSIQGGGNGSGSFVAGSGAILQFVGSYTLANPSSFSGAGKVDFGTGTLSGSSTFNSAVTLSGPGTWYGGTLTFPTATGVNIDASNSGNGEIQLVNETLTVLPGKTATFIGSGNIDIFGGATIINNGFFVAQNNKAIMDDQGDSAIFANNGTFTSNSGTGTTFTVSGIRFNNGGAVNVQAGTLSIQGGGTGRGLFVVNAGAVLQFADTTYTLASPSSFSGAGTVDFSNSILTGTSTFNSALALSGPGTWYGGTLTFPTGGVNIDASSSGNGEIQLINDTLTVAAGKTANFVGTGNIDMFGGASIVNSGTFVAQNNKVIMDDQGDNAATFSNKGTFIRNSGTGTFTVSGIAFNNTGTVDQETGVFTVNGGAFNNSGTVNVQSGTLSVQGGGSGTGASLL